MMGKMTCELGTHLVHILLITFGSFISGGISKSVNIFMSQISIIVKWFCVCEWKEHNVLVILEGSLINFDYVLCVLD